MRREHTDVALDRGDARRRSGAEAVEPNVVEVDGELITVDVARRIEALGCQEVPVRRPLPDRAHDAAVATWVLQYTSDPMHAVAELARVARRRVVIVQAAPDNELVQVWNLEAEVAGIAQAHHGYLLSRGAELLERAGFRVTMERVGIPVPCPKGARFLAETFGKLHFTGHPKLAAMIAITEPFVVRALAKGFATDDAVVLRAERT